LDVYFKNWSWFIEWLTPEEGVMRRINRVYAWERTPYQDVAVLELARIGKCLVIDGRVQSSLSDEFIYHEALVHPAMIAHGNPRSVLVLGGGEGATLREVLRHRSVERAVMVDLDPGVVELSKKYLEEWHQGCFGDERVTLVYMDGRRYVEEAVARGEQYDVVIADLVDPAEGGPAQRLYTVEFYELVKKLIGSSGVFVTQATSPSTYPDIYARLYWTLRRVFKKVSPYYTYVQSFNGLWGFHLASETVDASGLSATEVDERIKNSIYSPASLKFYDGSTHQGMFSLPKHIKKLLARQLPPSTDSDTVA
jgi:spermidine synthase